LLAPEPVDFEPPFLTAFDRFFVAVPNLKLPRSWQWNISVEQSLGLNQTLSASYVAAVGRRLLRQARLQNPNPDFAQLLVTTNNATSDYHALQLQLQRRLSRGLQALASYTWSHSIDSASNDSFSNAPTEVLDVNQERASSNYDVRHSFVAAVTYDFPSPARGKVARAIFRNWSVDTIIRARSAAPVNVITGQDPLDVGLSGSSSIARPDLVPGVSIWIDDPSVAGGKRINSGAFSIPVGQQGTLGRNALRGFSMSQVDFALRRRFPLTERLSLQFRAEFFNLFNHPNFGDPIGNLSNANFGQSLNMLAQSLGAGGLSGGFAPLYQVGGPRSIQLALRLQF
jgi:hypothetical protein